MLDWDRRADGTLRTPFLTIYWYDEERRRTRSHSTSETDLERGKAKLDAHYLTESGGVPVCPTCHRPMQQHGSLLVADAVTNYRLLHADKLPSADAIANRLAHVIDYMRATGGGDAACDQIDERWISDFRRWAEKQPIVSGRGNQRQRSLSTVENSVIQLAAAIRFSGAIPRFKAQPIKELNRTPEHRSDVAELAAMFAYCVAPQADTPSGASGRSRAARRCIAS